MYIHMWGNATTATVHGKSIYLCTTW